MFCFSHKLVEGVLFFLTPFFVASIKAANVVLLGFYEMCVEVFEVAGAHLGEFVLVDEPILFADPADAEGVGKFDELVSALRVADGEGAVVGEKFAHEGNRSISEVANDEVEVVFL